MTDTWFVITDTCSLWWMFASKFQVVFKQVMAAETGNTHTSIDVPAHICLFMCHSVALF